MIRLLFYIYGFNLLMSIALFLIHYFFGMKSNISDNWLAKILDILDIIQNLVWSQIFLIVAILGSLTIFLNLSKNIRDNYILSILTFSGIPLFYFAYLMVIFFSVFKLNEIPQSIITAIVISMIYFLLSISEFLVFRRKLKN